MTKRQGNGRPRCPKTKNQGEIDELAAEQAADAADDKARSVRPQPVSAVGRRTVIRADNDDGPLTLRDDTDLENDNSAGLGLTAEERADDRKTRQYVARIKGKKGKGARPRRGEVFGRRHLLEKPSGHVNLFEKQRPGSKDWTPPSERGADFKGMWTGNVGGVWDGLRRIKVFDRLVYDGPSTELIPVFIQAEAGDVPILKFRHLIYSRKSAGWAGALDSIPPRTAAEFQFGRYRFSFDAHGNRIWWPHCYGSRVLLEEVFSENPPEASFATDIFCEELCDIWRSVTLKEEEEHEGNRAWYRTALVKWAQQATVRDNKFRKAIIELTQKAAVGSDEFRKALVELLRVRGDDAKPRFPKLQPISAYPPAKPLTKSALLNRQYFYCASQRRPKGNNRRWSSDVADANDQLKRNIKAFERATRREAKREWVEVAPHQRINKKAALMLWPSEGSAKRRWQPVLWKRERLAPPTAYPPERPITQSRYCTSAYHCRSTLAATDPTDPWYAPWRGWRVFLQGDLKPLALSSALMQDFKARGGKIQICPPATLSIERRKPGRPPQGEKAMTNAEKQKKYRANRKLQNAAPDPLKPATALAVPLGERESRRRGLAP
jgi:hypothetical protein